MVRSLAVSDELKKCDAPDQYTVEIATTWNIRLNDDCFVRPLYGDMHGFIKKDGELVMMEISREKGHNNVYCSVSVEDFVAAPWGSFKDDVMSDERLSSLAKEVLKRVKGRIVVDESLNGSLKHVDPVR